MKAGNRTCSTKTYKIEIHCMENGNEIKHSDFDLAINKSEFADMVWLIESIWCDISEINLGSELEITKVKVYSKEENLFSSLAHIEEYMTKQQIEFRYNSSLDLVTYVNQQEWFGE